MHIMTIIAVHLSLLWPGGASRGPHHPRGESVAKHHVHYKPTKGTGQNIIRDAELLHDKEHIQEHLEEVIDKPNLDNMTNEELDFYYFQVHDVDRNNKLDGLEILQAIQHTRHEHESAGEEGEEAETDKIGDDADDETNSFEYFTDLIDKVFSEDDVDNDGFLSYPEYKAGREKESKIPKRPANNIEQPSVHML